MTATARKAASIVASLRDQALDVRIGILAPTEWAKRYDDAVALGVTFPSNLVALRIAFGGTALTDSGTAEEAREIVARMTWTEVAATIEGTAPRQDDPFLDRAVWNAAMDRENNR
jgi:hypothetical protein